jgi:AcrR family transcriptional regulator
MESFLRKTAVGKGCGLHISRRDQTMTDQDRHQGVVDVGTGTGVRPLRRDAERNRQLILAAARALFAERGLEVSLGEVAREAGLGVGTVYRRFPTRGALVDALFADRLTAIVEVVEEALRFPGGRRADLRLHGRVEGRLLEGSAATAQARVRRRSPRAGRARRGPPRPVRGGPSLCRKTVVI